MTHHSKVVFRLSPHVQSVVLTRCPLTVGNCPGWCGGAFHDSVN